MCCECLIVLIVVSVVSVLIVLRAEFLKVANVQTHYSANFFLNPRKISNLNFETGKNELFSYFCQNLTKLF